MTIDNVTPVEYANLGQSGEKKKWAKRLRRLLKGSR